MVAMFYIKLTSLNDFPLKEGPISPTGQFKQSLDYPRTQATQKKKSGLVSIDRACARIYGIGSVNVSVNGLSHMPRSSTETVYGTSEKQTFYNENSS